MKKPDKYEFLRGLGHYETGFYGYGFFTQKGKTKIIWFDNARDGNGGREYIYLKLCDKYINVEGGSLLTNSERQLKWHYKDYQNLEELVGDIVEFLLKFSSSFEVNLVRKWT